MPVGVGRLHLHAEGLQVVLPLALDVLAYEGQRHRDAEREEPRNDYQDPRTPLKIHFVMARVLCEEKME